VTFNFRDDDFTDVFTKEDWLQQALKIYDIKEDGWQPSQTSSIKIYQSKATKKYLTDLKERLDLPWYFTEDKIYEHLRDNIFKVGHKYKFLSEIGTRFKKDVYYKVVSHEDTCAIVSDSVNEHRISMNFMLIEFETISLTDKRKSVVDTLFPSI
jgi:hypothetical protein